MTETTTKTLSEVTGLVAATYVRMNRTRLYHWNIEGPQQVIQRLKLAVRQAETANDDGTLDLLAQRLRVHEKTQWMLESEASMTSEEFATAQIDNVAASAR